MAINLRLYALIVSIRFGSFRFDLAKAICPAV